MVAIATPVSLVIMLFPQQIVLIILGGGWLAAVPIIKTLAIFGFIRATFGSAYSLFLAVGKQEYLTYTTLIGIMGLAISILPLTNLYGLQGVALSTVVGSVVTIPPTIYFTYKILRSL